MKELTESDKVVSNKFYLTQEQVDCLKVAQKKVADQLDKQLEALACAKSHIPFIKTENNE